MLVVEDVLTTGGSTRETIAVATKAGAQVVGAASIVDRSGGRLRFDVPFKALLEYVLADLRARRVPVVRAGSSPVEQARLPSDALTRVAT